MTPETAALDDFRGEVRGWLEKHTPRDWRQRMAGAGDADYVALQRDWLVRLRDGGLAAPHWPREWGGGYSFAQQIVIHEEMSQVDAPRLSLYFVSLFHAASTLLAAASEEQKRRHLPAILGGEVWCQGFSEPGAGSDLASLRTRAERRGDVYVVNGQKVWSSGAHHADQALLLARTDPNAQKHRGISFFLLDMRSPGVLARPMRQATGSAEFCELFLEDVEIPLGRRIGAENDGWRIAQATLSSERGLTIMELSEHLRRAFGSLVELAAARHPGRGAQRIGDVAVRRRLVGFHAEVEILRLLVNRMLEALLRGGGVGPESSIIKLYYSELLQRFMEFGVELDGLHAQLAAPETPGAGYTSGVWMRDFIQSWGWTIGGGTNEIQRTVVGERALGLPKEPK